MIVNLTLHLSSKKYKCLCFTHAVQEAMKGEEITTNVDDYTDDQCMIPTLCERCYELNWPFEKESEDIENAKINDRINKGGYYDY